MRFKQSKLTEILLCESERFGAELKDNIHDFIRFISKKYYKDERGIFIAPEEGGLAEDSIWRWNPEYVTLLEETFQ